MAAAGSVAPTPNAAAGGGSVAAVGLSSRDVKDLAVSLGSPGAVAAAGGGAGGAGGAGSAVIDVVDVRVAELDPELMEPLQNKAKLTDTLTTLHNEDPALAGFVIEEYDKLQRALGKSHESVVKWLNTLKTLTKSIRANSQRLSASIGLHDAEIKKKEEIKRVCQSLRCRLTIDGTDLMDGWKWTDLI